MTVDALLPPERSTRVKTLNKPGCAQLCIRKSETCHNVNESENKSKEIGDGQGFKRGRRGSEEEEGIWGKGGEARRRVRVVFSC